MLTKIKAFWQRKLVRNTVWMMLGHGSRVGVYAAYFVLLARTLGAQGLGVFSAALALAKILLPFSGWGADEVMVRRVSRNHDEYPEALGNALIIIACSGSLFTVIAVVGSTWIFAGRVSWQLVLLVASAELILYRLQYVVRRAFQSYERLNVTAVFKAAPGFTVLGAVVLFKLTTPVPDVHTWAWWYFGAMAVPSVLGMIVMLAALGRPALRPRAALHQLREGVFFSLSESARTAYTDADKILLLRLLSQEFAGIYKAAYRILSVCMMPVLALLDAAYARFFRTGARGVGGSFRFALKLLPVSMLYSAAVAAGLYLCAPLLPLILGKGYAQSVEIVRWLALIPLVQGASYLLMQTLTGGGYQPWRAGGQILIALFNVAGNWLLIPIYGWRASAGVAMASEFMLAAMMFLLCRWAAARGPVDTEEPAPSSAGGGAPNPAKDQSD